MFLAKSAESAKIFIRKILIFSLRPGLKSDALSLAKSAKQRKDFYKKNPLFSLRPGLKSDACFAGNFISQKRR
ncbi:MAG: hypothetical protein BWK80_30000 [Desulfobacteraceae bacterium IS3]|nr:MAG: hypothetical protein BWK80_30000 [Desulfobacteraceae bacterium IS3]